MKKKSNSRVWIIVGVLALLVIVAVVVVVMKGRDTATAVQVDKVSRRTITQTVSAIGKIQPETEVKISSEASGEIIFLGAKEGDAIHKNQLVARIKPDFVETQLDQYRASLKASEVGIDIAKVEVDRSEAELKRVSALYQKEYASKQDLEVAKAAYDKAVGGYQSALSDKARNQAILKQAEVSLSRTSIYSPIDGTLTKLAVESGEKVVGTAQMQGTEMMRIADLHVMNAIVDVDENDVVKLKIGDSARVHVDAFPGRIFTGYVLEISHSPKEKGVGTQDEVIDFEVKIRLLDKEDALRPGMSCNVEMETETHTNVLAVPLQAVTIRSDASKTMTQPSDNGIHTEKVSTEKKLDDRPPQVVFVVDGGKAKQTRVETGISDKGFIEVNTGLTEGQLVASGSYNTVAKVLQDDMKVRVDSTSSKRKP